MARIIKKFALTGGPCAGKSTAMSRIEADLSQLGYKVLVVPETATELFSSGVNLGENGLTNIEFQTMILKSQISKEKIYEEIASLLPCEKVLIVCDRGAMDGKAYCSQEEIASAFKKLYINETALRDEYEAVFHLKTAADGAEAFYTLDNNVARTETPEEARLLDMKTIKSWTGHPHFRIVGNETDFVTKINRLMNQILKFLGEPVPLEIERKFLIEMPDIKGLLSTWNAVKSDIIQTYLESENGEEVRIRQSGTDGNYVYYLTKKQNITGLSRVERERTISKDEYLKLLMTADTNLRPIRKERYCFVYKNQYFELDVYPFWKNRAILEIELTEENQDLQIPDFIKVINEVTENPEYKNHSLAREIPA